MVASGMACKEGCRASKQYVIATPTIYVHIKLSGVLYTSAGEI